MEERFFEVTKLVDMKKRYPDTDVRSVMELIKGLIFNGDANKPIKRYEYKGDGDGNKNTEVKLKGDEEVAIGTTLDHKTGRFTTVKDYNKKFELIGKFAGSSHSVTKFTDNPFNLKPGHFARCERCGLVGISGIAVHYKRKGNQMTYVYKCWKHQAGDGHYVGVARYNGLTTWEKIVAKEKKGAAHIVVN